MRRRSVGIAVAAVLLLIAVALGQRAVEGSVPLAGGLLAAAVALRGRPGMPVAAVAIGLLAVWSRPDMSLNPPGEIRIDGPVVLQGRMVGGWERGPYGWNALIRAEVVSQGARVGRWRRSLRISVQCADEPPLVRRLRGRGHLSRPPRLFNQRPTAGAGWTLRVKSCRLLQFEGEPRLVARLHRWVVRRVSAGLSMSRGRAPGMVQALVLGRGFLVERSDRQNLRRLGLSHLFAVSGLHVALVAAIVSVGCAAAPRRVADTLLVCAVAVFVVVAGTRPAIVRAAAMAVVALMGLSMGRSTVPAQRLALVVSAMVCWEPLLVFDRGFQLTASATAGILVFVPIFQRAAGFRPGLIRTSLAVSLGAQAGCGPWLWPATGLLTPLAPVFNLVGVPWIGVLLAASLLWSIVALVSPDGARLLVPLLDLLAAPIASLHLIPPGWPSSATASLGPLTATALGLSVTTLVVWKRVGAKAGAIAFIALLLHKPVTWSGGEFVLFDVGQGDAMLLRDGDNTMLVDGGGWPRADIAARVLIPALAAQGVRSLDMAVVTHLDTDHCQGVADLLTYIPVAEVVVADHNRSSPCLLTLEASPRTPLRRTVRGDSWTVGRWRIEVLHPSAGEALSGNELSLVLRVGGFGRRLLLTGDIEAGAEGILTGRSALGALRSDVLKVAHHGSRTSSTVPFVRAVAPRLALVSSGRGNRYGHPSAEVVQRLQAAGARLLRTDRDGMVRLRFSAGGHLSVSRHRPWVPAPVDWPR